MEFLERVVVKRSQARHPEVFRAASPTEHVHPIAPPFLAVHGSNDGLIPVGQARGFVDRMRSVSEMLGSVVRPGQPIRPPRISEIIQELGTAPATLPSSAGPASEWWGSWRSVVRCHSASKSLAAKTTHVATVSSVPKHPEMLCAFGQSPACTAWARASSSGLRAPISANHLGTVAARSRVCTWFASHVTIGAQRSR
jgi:hypothetical protein